MPSIENLLLAAIHEERESLAPRVGADQRACEARIELFEALAQERERERLALGDAGATARLMARSVAHNVSLAERERGTAFTEVEARAVADRFVGVLGLPPETTELAVGEWKAMQP